MFLLLPLFHFGKRQLIHPLEKDGHGNVGHIRSVTQSGPWWKCYHVVMWSCATWHSSHWLHVATEHLKSSWSVTSLVAQWLRICLLMQGTQVRALVREDPTCRGATKPMHHNYWACTLEPASHNYWACLPQLLKPARLEPVLCNERSDHSEKPAHHNEE